MSIDLQNEQLVSLAHARRYLIPSSNGKSIAPATAWRWMSKGLLTPDGERVKLEVCYCGRTPMTSREAVNRFIHKLTEAKTADVPANTLSERPAATTRKLQAAGLLKT